MFMKRLLAVLFAAVMYVTAAHAGSAEFVRLEGAAVPPPTIDFNFLTMAQKGVMDSRIVCSRGTTATDGLYTDAAGSSYNSYLVDQVRLISGKGVLLEMSKTNRLLNSATPATQTTGSLATGSYILWVVGTGNAAVAAATATGTGFGTATGGSPVRFTITGAGTVTVTVTGSLNRFQLEEGSFATSFIPTAGVIATRGVDRCDMTYATKQAFSFSVTAMMPDATATTVIVRHLVNFNSSDSSRVGIRIQTTTAFPQMQILGGTGATAGGNTGAYVSGQYFTQTVVLTGTNYVQTKSQGSTLFAAATVPSGNTTISFGQTSTSSSTGWGGFISRFRYWPAPMGVNQAIATTR
jgi:hypothetical protein